MNPIVEKLVFTELDMDDGSKLISYVAESPIGTYYIDFDKDEQSYTSYCMYKDNIGEDFTIGEAIHRVNVFHKSNVLNCLSWQR